jgi:histone H3/H4
MSAEKSLALPKASVKRIMKLSDEVQNVSAEAVIAVSKVTEDFLNQIVAQAHEVSQAHNRKTIKVCTSFKSFLVLKIYKDPANNDREVFNHNHVHFFAGRGFDCCHTKQ